MSQKEARARIKINRLLEEAGWRFFDDENGRANIRLELHTRITRNDFDAMGENFERATRGFVDFLLLDEAGFPLVVLEAKSEDKNPLVGKEQARKYARSLNCRFVLLSNGNLHYFWDLEQGNPYLITSYPGPKDVQEFGRRKPNPEALVNELVGDDYIALTQYPNYQQAAAWKNEAERPHFIESNKLRFLRRYQQKAIHAIQREVKKGHDRFLFEMATGTGKTLTAAAVIKLFLRTGNARRALFLVDRLELEVQAFKAFNALLKNDFQTVIYKENREEWRRAEIVVTTVQALLFNNKYNRLFSPTDFDLVISDEAHRSIGGNSRAVFEYFVGYKLGLTATPKDYLKRAEGRQTNDPREMERRLLLDTYRTFGCESGEPTFRYSLLDGVRDGYLINPVVVDVRTEVTTQLLSDEGYAAVFETEEGEEETSYYRRDFEKKFFSEATNRLFCKTFLENALLDPISGEIGKSIIFAVRQPHATKLVQILNEMADLLFPGKYQSDFAVQVSSDVTDAQQFTINFTNNNLLGSANFIPAYKTSKARVCVTVGMMTTGYDCPDILNLALMRPIFSPTDFIQIKGRGTRKHNFLENLTDDRLKEQIGSAEKKSYKLFDFFATCQYFEEEYNYDQVIKLPAISGPPGSEAGSAGTAPFTYTGGFEYLDPDNVKLLKETAVGAEGMKIDRKFYEQVFSEELKADQFIKEKVLEERWDVVVEYVRQHLFDKPEAYVNPEKIRKAYGVDRRLSVREIVEHSLGYTPRFKSKDELLEEEFSKFVADLKPEEAESLMAMKYFFKAYVTDQHVRAIIEERRVAELYTNPTFSIEDFKAVPTQWRERIPEYIKDYVSLNQFMV